MTKEEGVSTPEKQAVRDAWRELGFYYHLDLRQRFWQLVGSRSGLMRFRDILAAYIADPKNEQLLEYEVYGPDEYLKIMTAEHPGIDDKTIDGRLSDLKHLGELIEDRLSQAVPGSTFSIKREYADDAKFSIIFQVMDDDFDPASEDPRLSQSTI
ncbi:MAG: hypothetical protein ACE5NW_07795 [Acidiferrobacterales bacterium]